MISSQNRFETMTEAPISRLIVRMALPTMVSMLVSSIYNLADTYFVSQINTEASAAVGVVFSLMAMIQAIGFTLGMGSGNYVSRLLGEKKETLAERVAATAFFTALLFGLAISALGLYGTQMLVILLGANEDVMSYAVSYTTYILIAAPFMMCSFVMNNQLRAQGYAAYSMIGLATGGVLNMILDPLFIFWWGIAGAGIATMASQMVSFVILVVLTSTVKGVIRIRPSRFRPSFTIYGEILHSGLPSLCRQGLSSAASVVLNFTAVQFGTAALAAMTIVNRIMMFIYSALIGFAQGFQPVCGFNWGAKRYDRVLQAYYFCLKVAVVMLSSLGVLFFLFAPQLITLFRDEQEVIQIGVTALRFQCASLPFQAYIMMSQFLTQSIGYGFRASLIAMGRQGLFLIPMYLLLPSFIGILGIESAQFFSDLLTVAMSFAIMNGVIQTIRTLAANTSYDSTLSPKTALKS